MQVPIRTSSVIISNLVTLDQLVRNEEFLSHKRLPWYWKYVICSCSSKKYFYKMIHNSCQWVRYEERCPRLFHCFCFEPWSDWRHRRRQLKHSTKKVYLATGAEASKGMCASPQSIKLIENWRQSTPNIWPPVDQLIETAKRGPGRIDSSRFFVIFGRKISEFSLLNSDLPVKCFRTGKPFSNARKSCGETVAFVDSEVKSIQFLCRCRVSEASVRF
jgi:hypothetical protein